MEGATQEILEKPGLYIYGSSIRGYSGRRKLGPFGQEISRKPFSGAKSDIDVALVVTDEEFRRLVKEGKLPVADKGRSHPLRVESFWESLSEKNCLNKVQSQEIRRLLKKMMKK